jgi:hypothetical protein
LSALGRRGQLLLPVATKVTKKVKSSQSLPLLIANSRPGALTRHRFFEQPLVAAQQRICYTRRATATNPRYFFLLRRLPASGESRAAHGGFVRLEGRFRFCMTDELSGEQCKAKAKQPVVLPGFAGLWPCAAKEA